MASDLYYAKEFQKLSFGDKGLRIIAASATSTAGESFCAIQALESTTISCDIDTVGGDTSPPTVSMSHDIVVDSNA